MISDFAKEKKIEDSLNAGEKKFRTIVENIPDFVFMMDINGKIISINAAGAEFIGVSAEKIEGKFLKDIFPADTVKSFRKSMKTAIKEGKIVSSETKIRFKGRDIWMANKLNPVKKDGKWIIIGISRDITKLKTAEWEKGERMKELKTIYELTRLIQTLDKTENICKKLVDIMPAGWQYPKITCARIVLGRKEYKTKNFRRTRWKQAADIRVSGKVKGKVEVFYLEKKPDFYEGPFLKEERSLINEIGLNISLHIERMESEKRTLKALEMNKYFFEKVPFGVNIVDKNGKILFLNDIMRNSAGDVIGKRCWEVYKDNKKQCDKCPLKEGIRPGESVIMEVDGVLGGKTFQINHAAMNFDGKVTVLEIFQDITEKRRKENEIKKSRNALEENVREMEKFQKLAVGRELRMVELKKRIKELEGKE